MFEFLQTREERRAFKKALKEVESERPEPITFSRVSQEQRVSHVNYSPSIKNPFRKPETTAIDLKYFKDWRKVNTVSSKNPAYQQPKPKPRPIIDDDDEGAQPAIEFPGETRRTLPISSVGIAERFAVKPKDEQKDTDAKTYIQQTRLNRNRTESNFSQIIRNVTNELNSIKKQTTTPPPAQTPVENKVKVEVVDFTPKPSVAEPKKPAVKRRPRGKGKRKFDADVITSVDWK